MKEENYVRVKFYDRTLWEKYLVVLGILSSGITLLSFFVTAEKMPINSYLLAIVFVMVLIVIFLYMWRKANRQNNVNIKINGTNVKILEGDIFELLDKRVEDREEEINVIGVNDYYDTIVDDRLIAKKSLHGQFIEKIIAKGKLNELEQLIETDSNLNRSDNKEVVENRKRGRKCRYKLGSVIEFESYILAAFTKFNEDNKAYLSAQEYVDFWMQFWENIDEIYAGRTINIPLMGAGITRFKNGKPSKQELLEIMLWTLKISGFQNTYSDRKINILIYKGDIQDIDFFHIQNDMDLR